MKNQNDLIISIVAIVLALIIAGVCLGTKREPPTIPSPEKVNLVPAALPAGDVVMASSLPSGSGGGAGGFGGRGAVGASAGAPGAMPSMAPAGGSGVGRGGGGKQMPGANGLANP